MWKWLIFLIFSLSMTIGAQDLTCRNLKFFISSGKPVYNEKNEPIGFIFEWKFGLLNEAEKEVEIGENSDMLNPLESALLDKINDSTSNLRFKILIETADSLEEANYSLINPGGTYTLNFDKNKRILRIPDDVPDIKDIVHFNAYKVTITWDNFSEFTFPFEYGKRTYTIRVGYANGFSIVDKEISIPFDYVVDQSSGKPVNIACMKKDISTQTSFFKEFIDREIGDSFKKGGWISVVISIIGLFGLVLFIVFWINFSSYNFLTNQKVCCGPESFMKWKKFLDDPSIEHFVDIMKEQKQFSKTPTVSQKVFYNAVVRHLRYKYHWSKYYQIQTRLENDLSVECEFRKTLRFKHRFLDWMGNIFNLDYFWNMSSISPMLGLLGTVVGIADSFNQIAKNPTMEQGQLIQSLSGGINVALYTTIFGLIVGIPMMLFYYLLKWKLDSQIGTIADQFNQFFYIKSGE